MQLDLPETYQSIENSEINQRNPTVRAKVVESDLEGFYSLSSNQAQVSSGCEIRIHG